MQAETKCVSLISVNVIQSLPSYVLEFILEHLDVPDFVSCGLVCHEFSLSYKKVLAWQQAKWGGLYHKLTLKNIRAHVTARKQEEFVVGKWDDLNRNRTEIRRANDVMTALLLTCTGLFVVSCVKPNDLLECRFSDFFSSLLTLPWLSRLVGPCLVLYAVLLVVFEEATSVKQRRNRMLLLIVGLSMSGWDFLAT